LKELVVFVKSESVEAVLARVVEPWVIYILCNDRFPVFSVTAYAKNDKQNLTKSERNALGKLADALFEKYRS
jgi:hypothetical protein